MQTFSNMRRDRTHQTYLKFLFFAVLIVLGQVMSSLYAYIPSFVGLIFCYILLHFKDENKIFIIPFAFAYLTFYDSNRGFYLFSYVMLFLLFYDFAVYKIKNMTSCENCILAVYIFVAYMGHYLLNVFLAYLANKPFPYFSNQYFYYIAIDALLAIMFFRVPK